MKARIHNPNSIRQRLSEMYQRNRLSGIKYGYISAYILFSVYLWATGQGFWPIILAIGVTGTYLKTR